MMTGVLLTGVALAADLHLQAGFVPQPWNSGHMRFKWRPRECRTGGLR